MEFIETPFFTWVIIPLFIFLLRIVDVSLGTIRIIFVSKGMIKVAPVIGFFEVFVWIVAISRIMGNLDNWLYYVAYAGGFGMGNYVGMLLEERLAIGHEMVRVVTKRDAASLVNRLRNEGYGVTYVDAQGADGDVGVLYIIVRRKMIKTVLEYINFYNPRALYTIESIKFVNKEIYHKTQITPHATLKMK
jgi:uncharacterized protein YebE (UPF0316 family)